MIAVRFQRAGSFPGRGAAIHDAKGGYGEVFEHKSLSFQIERYPAQSRRNAGMCCSQCKCGVWLILRFDKNIIKCIVNRWTSVFSVGPSIHSQSSLIWMFCHRREAETWKRVHIILRTNQTLHGQICYLTLGSTHNHLSFPLRKNTDIFQISQYFTAGRMSTIGLVRAIAAKPPAIVTIPFELPTVFFLSFFFCYLFKIVPEARENSLWTLNFGKNIPSNLPKTSNKSDPWYNFNLTLPRSTVGTDSKTITHRASSCGSILPFSLFFLLRACAVWGRSMRTWRNFPSTTWVTIPKSITYSSIPELVNAPSTALTPPLWDRVLAS